jgi:hypothetical protein
MPPMARVTRTRLTFDFIRAVFLPPPVSARPGNRTYLVHLTFTQCARSITQSLTYLHLFMFCALGVPLLCLPYSHCFLFLPFFPPSRSRESHRHTVPPRYRVNSTVCYTSVVPLLAGGRLADLAVQPVGYELMRKDPQGTTRHFWWSLKSVAKLRPPCKEFTTLLRPASARHSTLGAAGCSGLVGRLRGPSRHHTNLSRLFARDTLT